MYRVRLDEAARAELHRRCHEQGVKPRTRDRLEMVHLSDAGWSPVRIARHLGMFVGTVRTWIKAFLGAGFDALPDKPHPGYPSAITPAILEAVRDHVLASQRPYTASQLADWIAEQFGVRVSPEWLCHKLHAARLSYKRTSRNLKHKQKAEVVAAKKAEKEALEKRGTQASLTSAPSMSSAFR